jgi:parvulin-like peptidyl-prolyl isomerase
MLALRGLLLVVICAAAMTAAGCRDGHEPDPPADAADGEPAAPQEAFVVEVNGKRLFWRDVDAYVARRLAEQKRRNPSTADEDTKRSVLEREIVERFIREIVLLDEARRSGIRLDEHDFELAIAELKEQVPPGSSFAQELKRRNLTEAGLRKDPALRTRLLTAKLLKARVGEMPDPTEEELREAYDADTDRMHVPASVSLRHLLVGCDADSSGAERAQKKAFAEECRSRLVQGADIEEMARTHSDGPAKSFGGNMGTMTIPDLRAVLGHAVADASLSQALNEIGAVIETDLGYDIIQVLTRRPARAKPFEEARQELEEIVRARKQSQARAAFYDSVKAAAHIVYPES